MALVNTSEATERFRQKLNSGFFRHDRSQNTEVDYTVEKEARDTQAIADAAQNGFFKALFDIS